MIEHTREIVRTFNRIYGKQILVEPKGYFPPKEMGRIPGLDGKAKMSKSLGNCIYLSDSPDAIHKKVMSMYTDPSHVHVSDPGHVKGNTVFTYLDIFDHDKKQVAQLKDEYRHGGLGDVKIKQVLDDVLQAFLKPIRERRQHYENNLGEVVKMLRDGDRKARAVTNQTLQEVRDAIGFNYFKK